MTDVWGVDPSWEDTAGVVHAVPRSTIDSIHAAMGLDPSRSGRGVAGATSTTHPSSHGTGRDVRVVRPGAVVRLGSRSEVVLEDGASLAATEVTPPDLPLGIHEVCPVDGAPASWLVVSPGRCHLPDDLRTWGVTMQVPSSPSRTSWGIGDLHDVGTVAEWVRERGGGAVALSPLHAATPVSPLPRSPYSPSSRRWRNPLLLRVDAVPGAADDPVVAREGAAARRLLAGPPDARLVDRDAAWGHQRAALEHLWSRCAATERDRLTRWREEQGPALEGWARFCALAEVHGPRWSRWPTPLRHPEDPGVARAADDLADRVAFHTWLQLLVDDQLRAASTPGVRLIQDLAVGADPDGADAWLHQNLLALDVSIGAPPDDFAPDGQVWGLPPFVPWRLRDAGYRPLAELLRAAMAADGGVRIDHVMGLTRLFWVPDGSDPCDGAYVRFAGRELLDVLALESARAGAVVVGEDLGTVEPALRRDLAATRVLSTRVVWFEDDPPERYPRASVGMVTTHDLPTTAGAWTGADGTELVQLDRPAPEEADAALHRRLDALVDLEPGSPIDAVLERVHRRLGQAGSALVLATLEDMAAVPHRPNVPGTTTERVNWSTPLPVRVDDLPADPLADRVATALQEGRRAP